MPLLAAFNSFEYTPPPGSPFGRMSHHTLIAEDIHSTLHAHLALFRDERAITGILALDQIRLRRMEAIALRRVLATVLGAPPGNFLICATHTHNSPALSPWRPNDTGFAMLDQLCAQLTTLAGQMQSQWQPASLFWTRRNVPGIAHNRRSVYRADDGREQVATHGRRDAPGFLRAEDADETELRVLLVRNHAGALLGGVVNFPCHPTTMYTKSLFSADYPGVMRDALARELGAPFLFVNGFAGDQSPSHDCETTGRSLAAAVIDAMPDAEPVPHLPLAVASANVRLKLRVPSAQQVTLAWNHLEEVIRGRRPPPLVTPMYGHAFHFHDPNPVIDDWLAREIIARWELFRRGEVRQPTEQVEVQTIRLGDVALAACPGEPFACFARELRETSPLPKLMCIEHANGFAGYLPPPDAFPRGGYECCLADQSRMEPNAGPRMTRAALRLLKQLASPAIS